METEIKTWLSDIMQAIHEINGFLPEKQDFYEFQQDIKAKRAIERNLEIIGEAVNRILNTCRLPHQERRTNRRYTKQNHSRI